MSNTHVTQVASATTLATTTETVVAVLAGFITNNPGGTGVFLDGSVDVLTGTSTTAVVTKVYRAGATLPAVGSGLPGGQTQVGNSVTETVTAGNTVNVNLDAADTGGLANNSNGVPLVYFATVTQTGAAANGSCTYAILGANSATPTE